MMPKPEIAPKVNVAYWSDYHQTDIFGIVVDRTALECRIAYTSPRTGTEHTVSMPVEYVEAV